MYIHFNNNPVGRTSVGDCSVRAISKALNISWDDAHDLLSETSKQMGDVMNANDVISAVLRMNGFYREGLPDLCPDCYTVKDFARNNPVGTYVLGTGSHVITVINGDWYDSWNSQDEIPQYFWVR